MSNNVALSAGDFPDDWWVPKLNECTFTSHTGWTCTSTTATSVGNPPNSYMVNYSFRPEKPWLAYGVVINGRLLRGNSSTLCHWNVSGRAKNNVTTYTIPQPKHWTRWIILATALGTLGAAVLSYFNV